MVKLLIYKILNSKINKLVLFTVISLVIFSFSYNNGMFWDNVLFASKMGNHLYEKGVFNWTIPDSFDPGHPPTLGFCLAIFWKIFGHKLWVSHLLMLPFTIGLLYQIEKFVSYYFKNKIKVLFGTLLILADPTLFTQLVIVNPEVIQFFFFFLAVNSILYKNYNLKIIALFFLSIISYRSMMLCAGIFLFDFLNSYSIDKQKIKSILNSKFIVSYLIGSIPGVIYVILRLTEKGWLQSHPNSPWAELWQFADLRGILKNFVILGHRYADFGRIFILLFILFSLSRIKKNIFTKDIKQLLLLAFTSVFLVMIASLLATNSFGHRYFIVSYSSLILISFIILSTFYKRKIIIYISLIICLITGNLWIYPRNISQGWDASLAHVPYHNLRIEAINYLDKKSIKINEVASFFPNCTSIDNIDLSGDMRSFSNFNGKNNYLFYSNVYNLTDEEYEIIDNNYIIIKQFNKFNIHIYIYKHKQL